MFILAMSAFFFKSRSI